jgi:DNA polymerase I-like protein with 3'-5' exonuclease and polymerase domains
MVPPAVRRKHLLEKKELKFSRPDFVRDILFTREGFNLTPVVFTKTTKDLGEEERLPSTSSKDHLPYFTELDNDAGEFVRGLIDYQKTQTLSGTFIGKESENNGLWQYIAPNGCIYPTYMLHRTTTGRTASADPNGQNFPKRGRWAKAYQSIFVAKPGYRLVSCDLSQIELRIAAWMANDPVMLQIYRMGGDIHTATAKIVSGLSDTAWDALPPADRKLLRTKAKAVNFGFLYGMSWRKFIGYARTDYGVKYTEREAQLTRARFFERYSALPRWHDRVRDEVRRTGMVRALHGAIRHLPSIYSQDEAIRSSAERQAINSPVQRFGSDLGLIAMVQFSKRADPNIMRLIGFIHDALVMEVKIGYELEGITALLYAMENPPLEEWFGIRPPLPIVAEADIGMNGGSMIELAELPPADKRPAWFDEIGFNVVNDGDKESVFMERRMPLWWDREHIPGGQRNIDVIRRRLRL